MMQVLASIEGSAFSTWLRESGSIWAYPTVLTLHTIGLGILVGGHWVVSLRVLGQGRTVPLSAFEGLFPWMWGGFWLNLVTGVLLLAADATTKSTQWIFFVKMALVVVAVVLVSVMRRSLYAPGRDVDASGTPPRARALAWSALVVWMAAITAGRLMAYL